MGFSNCKKHEYFGELEEFPAFSKRRNMISTCKDVKSTFALICTKVMIFKNRPKKPTKEKEREREIVEFCNKEYLAEK